jgi:hypothetical protein
MYLFYGSNILRPQEKWKDEIDNSYAPFIPRIFEKPNALVPLDPSTSHPSESFVLEFFHFLLSHTFFLFFFLSLYCFLIFFLSFGSLFFDVVFLNRSEKKTSESSVLTKEMDAHLNTLGLGIQTQAVGAYPHPYQYELDHFKWDEEKLKPRPIQPLKSLEETPYEWIDTPEALHKLLDKLNQCTEIAVDLEVRFLLYFTFIIELCLFVVCLFVCSF